MGGCKAGRPRKTKPKGGTEWGATVPCAPTDGWRGRPAMAEQLTLTREINEYTTFFHVTEWGGLGSALLGGWDGTCHPSEPTLHHPSFFHCYLQRNSEAKRGVLLIRAMPNSSSGLSPPAPYYMHAPPAHRPATTRTGQQLA